MRGLTRARGSLPKAARRCVITSPRHDFGAVLQTATHTLTPILWLRARPWSVRTFDALSRLFGLRNQKLGAVLKSDRLSGYKYFAHFRLCQKLRRDRSVLWNRFHEDEVYAHGQPPQTAIPFTTAGLVVVEARIYPGIGL